MVSIKQIKSDIIGPILFQGASRIERSLDLIWDDTLKEFQINGDVVFKNTFNANSLHLKAGATANDITYILPITDPTAGQVLTASLPVLGVSTLSWTSSSGTGTADNGLTMTLGNVQLGGPLIQDTYIDNYFGMIWGGTTPLSAFITTVGDYASNTSSIIQYGYIASLYVQDALSGEYSSIYAQSGTGVTIATTNNTGTQVSQINIYNNSIGLASSDASTNNNMVVIDNISNKGLVYINDYSANFTEESLVTKRYVDSVAGGLYTADNGITLTLANFQLGGTLIQDTNIDGAANAWSMTFTNVNLFTANAVSFNLNSQTFVDTYAVGDINDTGANHLGTYSGSYTTVADDITLSSFVLTTIDSDIIELQAISSIVLNSTGATTIDSAAGGITISTNTGGDVSLVSVNNTFISAAAAALSINLYGTPQAVTNNGADNSMIVTDTVNSKGLVYVDDYSANFTPESLVSKRYVDSVAGGSYTFDNGLTNTLGNVQLGGALIQNTFINGAFGFHYGISTNLSEFTVRTNTATELYNIEPVSGDTASVILNPITSAIGFYSPAVINAQLIANATAIGITTQDLATSNFIAVDLHLTGQTVSDASTNNVLIITDSISSKGAVYAADYSANFTDNSLVTKLYADTVAGGTITANNGLTKTLNNIQLGGVLTQTTLVDGVSGTWSMNFGVMAEFNANTNESINLVNTDPVGGNQSSFVLDILKSSGSYYVPTVSTTGITMTSTAVSLYAEDVAGALTNYFEVYFAGQAVTNNGSDNSMIITDAVNSKGLVYIADYSANFTPESLISKRYALATFAPISGGAYVAKTGDTMSGNLLFTGGSGIDTTATAGTDTLNIGTGNADVVNIGRTGATVNIFGTRNFIQTTDLEILDKLIVLNKNGGASTGFGTGFEIEENAVITGYFKTNGTADGWLFKAPTSFQLELLTSSLTANRSYTAPNVNGTLITTGNLTDITAVGTITSGTWNGTPIANAYLANSTITVNGTSTALGGSVTITTTGTSNRISVTGGGGLTPTIDIASTYVGQTSITTVGTITSGTWNGTIIGTTYGGTGTGTTFTAGSVVFAGTSGIYNEDNANFFWDDTNNRLGIKTNAPAKTLHVAGDIRFEPSSGVLMDVESATVNTTNATTTTVQTVAIPTDTVVMIEARVHSRKTGGAGTGTTGDGNAYIRTVKAKNVGGTVTIGTVDSTFTSEDIASFNATMNVSGTNVIVEVTGSANNNVTWTSTCIITR